VPTIQKEIVKSTAIRYSRGWPEEEKELRSGEIEKGQKKELWAARDSRDLLTYSQSTKFLLSGEYSASNKSLVTTANHAKKKKKRKNPTTNPTTE